MNQPGRRNFFPLLVLIAVVALVFAGCGGDDGETTAAAETEATTAVDNGAGEEASETEGDDGEATEKDGGDKPVADEDFVAAVTEVCERAGAGAAEIGLNDEYETDAAEDPEAFAAEFSERWNQAEELMARTFADLREISAPKGQESEYKAFMDSNERLLELNTEAMEAYAKDPEFTMSEKAMKEQQRLATKQQRLTRSLGFPTNCFDEPAS